ncbi:magnesium transporter, partial [Nocardioides sp. SOB44]|nr:magnesium transporter [Nocardioides cremeus]
VWRDVEGLPRRAEPLGATHLVHALNERRPAAAATMIHDLPLARRAAVVGALDDERLADVLEEMPDEDQVEI